MLHLQAADTQVGKAPLVHFSMQIRAGIIRKLLSADKSICFSLALLSYLQIHTINQRWLCEIKGSGSADQATCHLGRKSGTKEPARSAVWCKHPSGNLISKIQFKRTLVSSKDLHKYKNNHRADKKKSVLTHALERQPSAEARVRKATGTLKTDPFRPLIPNWEFVFNNLKNSKFHFRPSIVFYAT